MDSLSGSQERVLLFEVEGFPRFAFFCGYAEGMLTVVSVSLFRIEWRTDEQALEFQQMRLSGNS